MLSRLNLRQYYIKSCLHHSLSISWQISKSNVVSATGDLEYPKEDLFTFASKRFAKFGERPAIVDGITGKNFTFNDVITKSKQLGKFFHSRGYKQNDVTAIHSPNCIEYPITFYGSCFAGMPLTTANPAYVENELVNQFNATNAKILFTTSEQMELARKVADSTNIDMLISLNEPNVNDSGVLYFHDALKEGNKHDDNVVNVDIDPMKQIVVLPYSSGTTGLPKGVMLSHNHIITNTLQFQDGLDANHEHYKEMIAVLPMYHVYCLHVISIVYLTRGCTIYTLPSFQPQTFLETIQKYKIESLPIVPPLLLFLLNHPICQNYDLSSVKHFLIGAAPTEENVVNAFHKKFPEANMYQGYGMTECLITHKQFQEDVTGFKQTPGSCGNLFRGIEMKVKCQDTGAALGPNETGEICIRGDQASFGYFNNPEATAQSFQPDGWVLTGDLGYYNDNTETFIVDRIKELIKYKGFQVAPAELEGILLSHDDIIDSCVIGIPDENAGELPRAYVVKKENSNVNEEDVISFMEGRVAPFKQLRGGVQFIDALPKLASGKILRRTLKQQYLDDLNEM